MATIPQNTRTIAIDFDGTIVEDAYPAIGRPRTFAFDSMKKLQEAGHRLILWTYRSDKYLEEAVEFCRVHGVEFYAVNKNYPEEEFNEHTPRKLNADLFIDDRNIGGFPGWGRIFQLITKQNIEDLQVKVPRRSFMDRFKKS